MRLVAERDARINLLLAMASATKADVAQLKTDALKRQTEIDALKRQTEIDSLKRQIGELQSSVSWRITGPLRYAARLLRKSRKSAL